jgi:hypothetical protein
MPAFLLVRGGHKEKSMFNSGHGDWSVSAGIGVAYAALNFATE